MSDFHRGNAYVSPPLAAPDIPEHKLAKNQLPTKQNQDLYLAATTGDQGGLKSALAAGGSPNWWNPDEGATAIHGAAIGGHAECIKLLLQNGAVIEERLLTNRNSPLHLACTNGHVEAAKVLINASAAVNTGNCYGNAPTHSALIGGHRAVVELLLESGAEANWTNNKGSSLLHFLGYSPMTDIEKKAVARKLLEVGVNIDTKDENGMTVLHVVGQNGDKELATFLFENGADHTLKDNNGKTPLQWAQLNSHTEVGALL
ncbi:unnamed protein product, partial [Laminaria digitata]